VVYRAAVFAGGAVHTSAQHSAVTGDAPSSLPQVTRSVDDPDRAVGGFLVTCLLTSPPAAVILDEDGDYVWWYTYDVDEKAEMTRARLSADGEWMLFRLSVADDDGYTQVRVRLDGTEVEELSIPDTHHDFVELPDGTIATLAFDDRDIDGETIRGDRIVELPTDAEPVQVWSSWDSFVYHPEDVGITGEWTHANYLVYEPDAQMYVVGMRNIDTLARIDRATGDVVWSFGRYSDIDTEDGLLPFVGQHGFEIYGDHVLVFDNGPVERLRSRAVIYEIDADTRTATQVGGYSTEPPLYAPILGDVERLSDDVVLVTWSVQGQVDQVARGGELIWRLNLELGGVFGFSDWLPSLDELP
jgi:hypothetical protein